VGILSRDFLDLGGRPTVDSGLHRLEKRGEIRRVIRGIYDYPRFSKLLDQSLRPDIDQVARALARKFRWRIQPSGATALNFLGLSTDTRASHHDQENYSPTEGRIHLCRLVLSAKLSLAVARRAIHSRHLRAQQQETQRCGNANVNPRTAGERESERENIWRERLVHIFYTINIYRQTINMKIR
jgi:hypothetical protein